MIGFPPNTENAKASMLIHGPPIWQHRVKRLSTLSKLLLFFKETNKHKSRTNNINFCFYLKEQSND